MAKWDVGQCANCDVPLSTDVNPRLFCGDRCRDYAKDVRYFRRCYRDGRWLDPDVTAALQTRMAFLVVGGYDRRTRRVEDDVRQQVLSANAGLCVACNMANATQVDHINGSSNARENLQGLCAACHSAKTRSNFEPMGPEETVLRDAFLALVHRKRPNRLCYDESRWEQAWLGLLSETREWSDLVNDADDAGYWGDGESGTIEDEEHGYYLTMLAERDD